jgi:hypothetical protein
MDATVLERRNTVVPYPIPDAALDDRLGWIGTAGSGKTYNAGSAVERLLGSGARVVIVDPLDVWWGLRLTGDGKPSRFNLPIFGGEHGDLPLNEHAGKLIGETVANMAESCIVSLGGLPTKAAEQRFMLAFLESLYRHTSGNSVHVVFDEADLWAPQNAGKEGGNGPKLQALMEQIVRRGRIKGFIPWLITQRPAVLSKDVLSQVDGLVAFKLTASQDRAALGLWIEGQADREEGKRILGSLPTMQRGQGIVWVPGRGVLDTVAFPLKRTFDSSRTPTRGEVVEKRELKPLDLDKLKGKLASLEEEQKASDPRALKAEVARLTRELAKAEKVKAAPPQIVHANADEIEVAREEGRQEGYVAGVQAAADAVAALGGKQGKRKALPFAVDYQHAQAGAPQPRLAVADRSPQPTGGPAQRILNALAWWKVLGHDRPLNEQVSFIAGYTHGSGGYNSPRGALKSAGLVDYPEPGRVSLTEAGEEQAETPDAPPTGEELRRRVLGKLAGPQQRILSVLIEAYPEAVSNEECAAKAGYTHGSGGYNNPRGNLKTLNIIGYPSPGFVRASDWLFP